MKVLSGLASKCVLIARLRGRAAGFAVSLRSRQPRQLVPMAARIFSSSLFASFRKAKSVTGVTMRSDERYDRGFGGHQSLVVTTAQNAEFQRDSQRTRVPKPAHHTSNYSYRGQVCLAAAKFCSGPRSPNLGWV